MENGGPGNGRELRGAHTATEWAGAGGPALGTPATPENDGEAGGEARRTTDQMKVRKRSCRLFYYGAWCVACWGAGVRAGPQALVDRAQRPRRRRWVSVSLCQTASPTSSRPGGSYSLHATVQNKEVLRSEVTSGGSQQEVVEPLTQARVSVANAICILSKHDPSLVRIVDD